MTRVRHRAERFRRWILIVGLLYVVAALAWVVWPFFTRRLENITDFFSTGLIGTPFLPEVATKDEVGYGIGLALFLGLLLLAQWAFLRLRRGWVARLSTVGRPLRSSIFAAAAMATLLTAGLFALILEIPNQWEPLLDSLMKGWVRFGAFWMALLLVWSVWTMAFYAYWRQGDRYTQLGRMIRGLVAGSLLEALVAVPVHALVWNRGNCYCARGSYTTLVFAGTVLFWAFGPGIVLLYLREHHRRGRLFVHCERCGYDLRGSSERCPECGTPIPPVTPID